MKKRYWFNNPEELCEYLSKRHIGNVYGGFYQWDTDYGNGEDKGLIQTNYGMQGNWPIKLVALVAESRCSRCNKKVDYWDRVMAVDGDIVDAWYLSSDQLPERIKDWGIIAKDNEYWENREIFWWIFDQYDN